MTTDLQSQTQAQNEHSEIGEDWVQVSRSQVKTTAEPVLNETRVVNQAAETGCAHPELKEGVSTLVRRVQRREK